MTIEDDGMEECDGCGNFMFECECYELSGKVLRPDFVFMDDIQTSEEELLHPSLQICPVCNEINFQCTCEEEDDSNII